MLFLPWRDATQLRPPQNTIPCDSGDLDLAARAMHYMPLGSTVFVLLQKASRPFLPGTDAKANHARVVRLFDADLAVG